MVLDDVKSFKRKALQWASSFNVCAYLDNNGYPSNLQTDFDAILAVGVEQSATAIDSNIDTLTQFSTIPHQWKFGFLSYELKNIFESLESKNPTLFNFPPFYFFIPTYILRFVGEEVYVLKGPQNILTYIDDIIPIAASGSPINICSKISKEEYLCHLSNIQYHIRRGDVYEINFCQEFYAENCKLSPIDIFWQLNTLSPMPFASFFKYHDQYIISASPERFLAKRNNTIISQPIKGTAARSHTFKDDEINKEHLRNSVKEQAENVMIVDLVRNDLSKVAISKTVKVDELMGIYSFTQVHQMISTISCKIDAEISFTEILKHTFPMGSMTGAPKIKAMQLIDKYESTQRNIYSGSLGYISPNGDFDFNVVIRSILYHQLQRYVSFQVGSAITHLSNPEQEYEECLLKAKAMITVLKNANTTFQ